MLCNFSILVHFFEEVFQFSLNMTAKVSMDSMKITSDLSPSGLVRVLWNVLNGSSRQKNENLSSCMYITFLRYPYLVGV